MGLIGTLIQLVFKRIFSFRPTIRKEGGLLVAFSDWRSQIFCLGFGGRKVVVDTQSKIIRILIRRFWFLIRVRRIEFDWIEEVMYSYHDLAPGSVIPFDSYQEDDLFVVALRLKNGEHVTLFRFYGRGSFVNNSVFPDWMYWEDQLEAQITKGDQESESLAYADIVSHLVGAPIGNPEP